MGVIIGFSGVDGSGKTTMADLLIEHLNQSGIDVTYHHELNRSHIMVKLINLFAGRKRTERLKTSLFLKTNLLSNKENEFPYLSFYYLIFWLESVFLYLHFKFKKSIIISDRWPSDLIGHFKSLNFNNQIIHKLFLIYPKPDFLILLSVPSQLAYSRKRHEKGHRLHNTDYYRTLQSNLLPIANNFKKCKIIDSSRPKEEVLNDVLLAIKPFITI
tara:strand:- start:240 stop:884 length:645 start_codon:yes stop_codon:yes gene_type:complete